VYIITTAVAENDSIVSLGLGLNEMGDQGGGYVGGMLWGNKRLRSGGWS
jgi:hypothetical protein